MTPEKLKDIAQVADMTIKSMREFGDAYTVDELVAGVVAAFQSEAWTPELRQRLRGYIEKKLAQP